MQAALDACEAALRDARPIYESAKVLRKAIKAFREANPRPQPTPTKTNG